jgi:signal transduction histidine kinase
LPEEHCQEADRMIAARKLIGGIAHDFNNIICAINIFSELTMSDCDCVPAAQESLKEIIMANNQGKKLVEQLSAFSKTGSSGDIPFRMNDVIRDAVELLREFCPTGISINTIIRSSCNYITGNPNQIFQVLINISLSIFQTMHEEMNDPEKNNQECELVISLTDAELASTHPQMSHLEPGLYTKLSVSTYSYEIDSGFSKNADKPYLTMEKKSGGTWLGLAMAKDIVHAHNGGIAVESDSGNGPTFHIFLPAKGT